MNLIQFFESGLWDHTSPSALEFLALKLGTGRTIYPSDRNYSEKGQKILNEVRSDFSDEDTCEEDFCESSYSTDSEISSDSDEFSHPEKNDSEKKKYYSGKNRFKW